MHLQWMCIRIMVLMWMRPEGGYDMKHGLIGPGVYASHGYERSHRDGAKNTLKLLKAYLG